jgi:ATP-dependent exoDNAse (exonuclease V) beta subunit
MLLSQGRSIKAGDVLILVRRREPFTTPMIRALKHANIPVAGADRMRLMDQLAVQDLVASRSARWRSPRRARRRNSPPPRATARP